MVYIRIHLDGGGTYIQPIKLLADAIEAELDGVGLNDTITLELTKLEMSKQEYGQLPEFTGH